MGADFSLHKIFIENNDPIIEVKKLKAAIQKIMMDNNLDSVLNEEESDRSFVVIPEGRWIHIGDSYGSDSDGEAGFNSLSKMISKLYPVIDIHMSDGAAIHFYQYKNLALIDKYGNMNFPFFWFKNDEESKPYEGKIDLWKNFLIDNKEDKRLRNTWTQSIVDSTNETKNADQILTETAALFGWQEPLYSTGYSHDMEGIPLKYDEYFKYFDIHFDELEEMHFKFKDKA
jgi:hypothetical protein